MFWKQEIAGSNPASPNMYYINSENTEDTFGEAETFQEAIQLAKKITKEEQIDTLFFIEYKGLSIMQFVRLPDGEVKIVGE